MTILALQHSSLSSFPALQHAFFGRTGGHSTGVYESLNVGYGSSDDKAVIARNRVAALAHLGMEEMRLVTLTQTHSNIVMTVKEPLLHSIEGDALVTNTPHLALGIQTADCAPVLFYDPQAGVIGAAHAGWKGALNGVLEATVRAMGALGAHPENIIAVIGACIQPASYEVDSVFYQTFLGEAAAYQTFFSAGATPLKFQFDLPNFVRFRLYNCGVTQVEDLAEDTFSQPEKFFSFRRATQAGEKEYGRELSVIALVQ